MLKTPVRRREFSEFRHSPNPTSAINRKVEKLSPVQKLTTSASRYSHTPSNLKNEHNHQTSTSTKHLNIPAQPIHKENRSHSQSKQICVNCVNKILVEQHNQKHAKQIEDNVHYMHHQHELAIEEARMKQKLENDKKIRELEFSRQRDAESKKVRERVKELEEKRKESERLRLMKEKDELEKSRRLETEKLKRENLKRELQKQMHDEMERRQQQRKALSKHKPLDFAFTNYVERQSQKEANNAKLISDYKATIREQIQEKEQRARKEKYQERLWYIRQREMESSKSIYQPHVKVTEANNKDYLLQQIQERSNKKLQQLEYDRLKTEQAVVIAQTQFRDSLRRQNDIKHRKTETYMNDLSKQVHQNQVRRIKQQEFEKTPVFSQPYQEKKPLLQDCGNCHHLYPKSYLSVFNY